MALWLDGQADFSYPQNDPVLSTASTAGLTTGVAVGYHHGWPAPDHGDEVSLSLDFDYVFPVTTITPLPVLLDPQYNFAAYQASPVKLSVIRVLMCPRLSLWELENVQLSGMHETTVTVLCTPR